MRWGAAIRDIALIAATAVAVRGVIIYTSGYAGVARARKLAALDLSIIPVLIIGFAISGALARERRWRHGFVVAAGLWLLEFVYVVFTPSLLLPWLFSWILAFSFMGLGVSLSYLFVRPTRGGGGLLARSDAPNTPTPRERT